jgi:integrase
VNPLLRSEKRTFGEAADYYKTMYMIPNGQLGDAKDVERYVEFFGASTLLSQIDQDTCKKLFMQWIEVMQVQSLIRRWTILISIFRENAKWMKTNPAKGIITKAMRKKAAKKKEVYFTDEQYFKLLELAETEEMKDILIVYRHTGFRKGEGKRFSLEDIDFTTNTIHVLGKNGEYDTLPLLPEVRKRVLEIKARRAITTGPILDLTNITKRFRKLVTKAGYYKPYPLNLTLHSLRHSWGTYVQKNYKDTNVTQKLMRHKDIKMTMRYAHAAQDMIRSAGIAGSATPPSADRELTAEEQIKKLS